MRLILYVISLSLFNLIVIDHILAEDYFYFRGYKLPCNNCIVLRSGECQISQREFSVLINCELLLTEILQKQILNPSLSEKTLVSLLHDPLTNDVQFLSLLIILSKSSFKDKLLKAVPVNLLEKHLGVFSLIFENKNLTEELYQFFWSSILKLSDAKISLLEKHQFRARLFSKLTYPSLNLIYQDLDYLSADELIPTLKIYHQENLSSLFAKELEILNEIITACILNDSQEKCSSANIQNLSKDSLIFIGKIQINKISSDYMPQSADDAYNKIALLSNSLFPELRTTKSHFLLKSNLNILVSSKHLTLKFSPRDLELLKLYAKNDLEIRKIIKSLLLSHPELFNEAKEFIKEINFLDSQNKLDFTSALIFLLISLPIFIILRNTYLVSLKVYRPEISLSAEERQELRGLREFFLLSPGDSLSALTKRYHQLARELHPDTKISENTTNSEDAFKLLNLNYQRTKDLMLRMKKYNSIKPIV